MPVLHVGDIEIVAQTQQLTSPSIHIKKSDGEMYYVALSPLGGGIFDGSETLVYSESSINKCHSINLEPGIYRVEMRGGTGGKPYRCTSGSGMTNAMGDIVSSIFKLNETTTVYSLRGGDGNNSPTIGTYQIPGGGASGVDSILVVGNRTIRATGGVGSRCMNLTVTSFGGGGGYGITNRCSGGGGGFYSDTTINNGGNAYKYSSIASCSGGGGGANTSSGGTGGNIASGSPNFYLNAGKSATSSGGGNGGDVENLLGTSMTKNKASGGIGGKNVSYSCGGQTAISYGGGGGGATCALRVDSTCENLGSWCESDCADGGDGGSGSTGTSGDSFLNIYKIG